MRFNLKKKKDWWQKPANELGTDNSGWIDSHRDLFTVKVVHYTFFLYNVLFSSFLLDKWRTNKSRLRLKMLEWHCQEKATYFTPHGSIIMAKMFTNILLLLSFNVEIFSIHNKAVVIKWALDWNLTKNLKCNI
jgi:hypothetical protein